MLSGAVWPGGVGAAHDGVRSAAALCGAARAPAALGEKAHRRAGWRAGQAALLEAARVLADAARVLAERGHQPPTNPHGLT
jgi:hypothetical protein